MHVLDERPDSAYVILKGVKYGKLTEEKDKASYILAHARANLGMGRSLVTDTLISKAVDFYKTSGDTAAWIEAVIAYAHHLRSVDRKEEAFDMIDSLSVMMPSDIQWRLNQQLLGFCFSDKELKRSLSIIDRQVKSADTERRRFNFEIKKITPLISSGRSEDAVALCDSLFALPDVPEIGSDEWFYLRINYAAALGERRATAPKAVAIIGDIIDRLKDVPAQKRVEFYIPMVNLQLNAGNLSEAARYLDMIDSLGLNLTSEDPVAASYLEFLRITLDYEKTGALSLSRLSNVAQSLRKVSNDLEIKRQERDDALETAYDLSRDNYELTIRHQRLWLFIAATILLGLIIVSAIYFIALRRRQRLIEAEERIEALEELVKSADSPSTDNRQGLLKKLLLQQLGIIKTFAESPTAQNQEALKKISNVGNRESMIDTLVKWDDFYPIIDELYDGFHYDLLNDYPGLFSEREIQILCLLRADFSTKEIAVLIQQTSNSVYVSKTSIRKKLGLTPKEDFVAYLTSRN